MVGKEKETREPLTEITETSDGALLTAELPGVAQDAIKIAVSKEILKLEAEGTRGEFSTIQALPFEPDQDRISVTFSQGVLAVSLKRKPDDVEHVGEKQVPIESVVEASFEEMGKEINILRDELIKVSEERASLEERVHFLQRDFQNLKRRHDNEKESIADSKIEELAIGLMDVLDNFRLAKESIHKAKGKKESESAMIKGLEMIENQVISVFQRVGISKLTTEGLQFDPNYHEAVGYLEKDDIEDEIIATEVKPGYIYKGKALRPAQVMVNRRPAKAEKKEK
jgi:molecular chaperone GrpE